MAERRKKLLIVDGYNVLRSGSRYRQMPQDDFTDDWFNTAREALINDVLVYIGSDTKGIIVFDGGENPLSDGQQRDYGALTVIFSPAGSSADRLIESLAYRAKSSGIPTQVVTSDSTVQDTVFGRTVVRLSANDFSREMAEAIRQTTLDDTPHIATKNTVADRIDKRTLDALRMLRDRTDGKN